MQKPSHALVKGTISESEYNSDEMVITVTNGTYDITPVNKRDTSLMDVSLDSNLQWINMPRDRNCGLQIRTIQ